MRDVFIRHDADQERNLPVREMLIQTFDYRVDPLRIVPAVRDEDRVSAKQLKARGPANEKQTIFQILIRKIPAFLTK